MTTTPAPFIVRITKNLHWTERAFLLALAIGTLLFHYKIDSNVLTFSLIGLAITFFLYSYKPLEIVRDEDEPLDIVKDKDELLDILRDEEEQSGFLDLLVLQFLPRVMWLSSAVSTMGLLFYLLEFGNGSFKNMLIIGGLTIGIALVFLTIISFTGVKNIKAIMPVLYRAIPVFLIDCYILLV